MSASKLPDHPSLEYLRKLAKDRLRELRRTTPDAKLAEALLAVARDHGFPSWRALKAEVDRRQSQPIAELFDACRRGDVDRMRALLAADAGLARAVDINAPYGAWTILHHAARHGSAAAIRLLLANGADPNAREQGDNTYPLHWAAARGDFDIMAALLDGGGDVHGFGADHAGDVIGWGTFFSEPGKDVRAVADFLVGRGARHSIFSAMSVGDPDLVRAVVEQNPDELERRLSKFEHRATPLHLAILKKRDDLFDLLMELGADIEAEDMHGQTPLSFALASGYRHAAQRLQAAGARPPRTIAAVDFREAVSRLAQSTKHLDPMISVPDVAAALEWYVSIGFTEVARWANDTGAGVTWGLVRFGEAEVMLSLNGYKGQHSVSLWFYTEHVDELYRLFKARQLEAAQAQSRGEAATPIDIMQDIYDPMYGGREFAVRDLNGYELYFRRG